MTKVRIIADNVKDKSRYGEEIVVIRNNEEIKVSGDKLLFHGDIIEVNSKYAKKLVESKIVEYVNEKKESSSANKRNDFEEIDNKGE